MEHGLRETGEADPANRVIERWNKQAEKLRRALGLVREMDVHLAKINSLRESVGDGEASRSRLSRLCLKQIATVVKRLERSRKAAAKKLSGEIEKRRERLERSSKGLIDGPVSANLLTAPTSSGELHTMIAGLAANVPGLDAKTLHEFRKRVKSVRYVAEMAAVDDKRVAQQVAALRTMQSALGEWHDCQSLSKEARRILKRDAEQGGVVELLETMTGESLENALAVCRRIMERLIEVDAKKAVSMDELPPKRAVRKAALESRAEQQFA